MKTLMLEGSRLVLVEGLCGAGKTTLAGRLGRYLADKGIAANFYNEGAAGHPASLNFMRISPPDEFAAAHTIKAKSLSVWSISFRNVFVHSCKF